MTSAHWGYGALGGAALGWYYGDSLWEIGAGAALGTPWGVRALAAGSQTTVSGLGWLSATRVGIAARGAVVAAASGAGAAMLAAAVPLAAGYAASDMIAGQRGRTDYMEFITGKVSPRDYWDAVTLSSMR